MTASHDDHRAWLFAQLETTYRAGLSWTHIGAVLARARRPPPGLQRFNAELAAGAVLADAGRRSGFFLPWEVRLLQAAETGGRLEALFGRLAKHYRERAVHGRRLRNRMLYPALVLVLALLILPLPALLTGRLDPAGYLARTALPLVLLYVALRWFGRAWRRLLSGEPGWLADQLLVRLPIVRLRLRRDLLMTLQLALEAGIPALEALALARDGCVSGELRGRMVAAIRDVEQGAPLGRALADAALLPDGALAELLATGEHAGRLDEMLAHGVAGLDEQLRSRLETLAEWLPRLVYAGVVGILLFGWLG